MMHTQKVCINYFMDQLKVCSKCKESKLRSEFHKNKSNTSGLQDQCKVCKKESNGNWYKNNSEHVKEYSKNWYKANTERAKETRRNWCKANPERARECSKNWWRDNPERAKECAKSKMLRYREVNKNRPESYYLDREGRFKYCFNCKLDKPLIRFTKHLGRIDGFQSKCLDCQNEYSKQRRKTDIQFKLRADLRRATLRLINLSGKIKERSTEETLGAEFTEIENIIFTQMLKYGFTEEQLLNGDVELDHKTPLAWFDLTNEDEYREAGHISNLHYILKEENQKKGDRYAHGPNNEIILHEEWLKKRQVPTISH